MVALVVLGCSGRELCSAVFLAFRGTHARPHTQVHGDIQLGENRPARPPPSPVLSISSLLIASIFDSVSFCSCVCECVTEIKRERESVCVSE